MSFVSVPRPQRSPASLQILVALIGGLLLFLLAIGLMTGGYQLLYAGRVFPGITMAGVDLTNMTPEQATADLSQRLTYPTSGQVVFRDGDRVWVATPAELGMVFDAGTSIQSAYNVGRQGGLFTDLAGQLNAWQGGLDLKPVIVFDERVAHGYLQNIAAQIGQPMIETDLHLNGAEVVYTQGQTGRLINVDATLANLLTQLLAFRDGEVQLVVEEQSPMVLDASAQAETLRQILSAPLMLYVPDAQPGDPGQQTIEPSVLAGMLTVGRVQTDAGWQYQVSADAQALEQFLGQIAPLLDQNPVNARFYFDDKTRELVLVQSALVGRTLDIAATIYAIQTGLLAGEHNIALALNTALPEVGNDATAQSLGITELVSDGYYNTTYFRGSDAARLQNIETSAQQFYGLLIPPNTTFSMADVLGDISLDNGYAEALIIYNGRTITGVGGGVCQVSTTLFRTAFFAGYPIVERHAHAFRVFYYEQRPGMGTDNALAGLDATVYFPLVDLKFTNDRPTWLLMETYFHRDEMSLEWKFYSTNDGRTVQWQNLGLRNIVPAPEPLFEENADLPAGTCKKVDYAAEGADITVTRAVQSASGQTMFNDTFQTSYEPWQAVYQYGPGTENPQALLDQGLCH
ncbi:MAG: VanW family protein [Candidatus Atribacteria bacterium]|nr:VanW family protein [Candidatus Atribacteria bacterium]